MIIPRHCRVGRPDRVHSGVDKGKDAKAFVVRHADALGEFHSTTTVAVRGIAAAPIL